MAENTLDKIIQDATRLPPDQQQRLIQVLTERLSQPSPKKTIEQIASEQGKGPGVLQDPRPGFILSGG